MAELLPLRAEDPERPWSEPGVYTVAPGIHRIPLPLPGDALKAVNVYAVDLDSTGGTMLVDSGQIGSGALEGLAAALAALGRGLSDVRRILVTHLYRDHFTLAVELRRLFGATVELGAGERDSLSAVRKMVHGLEAQLDVLVRCGARDLVAQLRTMDGTGGMPQEIWEEPDHWLLDGAVVPAGQRSLTAVTTPGHTRGHLVFHDPRGAVMFTGDHVLPHITPSIGFEAAPVAQPLRDFLDSLRRLRALPDARMLPAHGPVSPSVHARVDELLAHHDARLAATAAQVARGRDSAASVAAGLTWTRRERTLAELDPFNRMLAVLETKAHLDLLELQGVLTGEEVDGVRRYRTR